jgi:hypothetical protein
MQQRYVAPYRFGRGDEPEPRRRQVCGYDASRRFICIDQQDGPPPARGRR